MEKNHTGVFIREPLTKQDYQKIKEEILSSHDEDCYQTMLDYGFSTEDIIPILAHTTPEILFVNPHGELTAYRLENDLLGSFEQHDDGTEDYVCNNSTIFGDDQFITIEELVEDHQQFILRSFVSSYFLEYHYWLYSPKKMETLQQQTVSEILKRYQSPVDVVQENNGFSKKYKRPIYSHPAYLKTTISKK